MSEPAVMPEFDLQLNTNNDWLSNSRNKQPARKQTSTKDEAIQDFVAKALKAGIIEESQATSWSHVHLTPKPNGRWRFCIDYRSLNLNTKSLGWPIPNIPQMLQRIGERKPKYFGVLDLTQGYYQAPINKKSRDFTTFRTSRGLYRWKRLPMGLKGAPSWFQQHMANTVLNNLIYSICEVYLDDIIIYGTSEEEFLDNLKKVLSRLNQHNITINPEKCKIGLDEVEYVGHVINANGTTFSREKKQEIVNFIKPETQKQLKGFLGLANYFRSNVRNYSDLACPLNRVLHNYKPYKIIQWTDELINSFNQIKEAINNCPQLWFMEPVGIDTPIFLQTDASNYGIGAYLFQRVNGVEHPIAILSKGLSKTELKWSTIEKEQYAIFFSLCKLDHLLRDVHFTLQTDHKNLTLLNTDPRDKVQRWRLAIQYFDFDVEHIEGKLNIVADGLSRLCQEVDNEVTSIHEIIDCITMNFDVILNNNIKNKYQATEYLNVLSEFRETRSQSKGKVQHLQSKQNEGEVISSNVTSLLPHIRTIIQKVHNNVIGHLGIDATYNKLKTNNITWANMKNDIKTYIQQCSCCQKMSHIKHHIEMAPFTTASYSIMDTISIDAIGPLPTTEDGYSYIIVIVDTFSRFVILAPARDTTANSAADAILKWCGLFGFPSKIRTDNATMFVNEIIEQLLRNIGSEHIRIHPYSHEENGIVERLNKEVNRHIRAIAFGMKNKTKWDKYLSLVQRTINSMIHKSIKISPAQIVFGNAVNLDRGLINNNTIYKKLSKTLDEHYVNNLLKVQAEIISLAEKAQKDIDTYHIADRSKVESSTFPINSYVLVNYENDNNRPPSKLHTQLRGPLRVVNINADNTSYTLQNLVNNKLESFHIKKIRPFIYDPKVTNPEDVALHDEDFERIEHVTNHRFKNNNKKKSALQLFIKWDNEIAPTWHDWHRDFASNEEVHKYLRANKLGRFIPPTYTYPKTDTRYAAEKAETIRLQQQSKHSRKRKRSRGF